MNCRKQYSWCSLRGKLAEVAVYSLVRSRFCRNKHSAADYCGNLLGSKGIGAGSSPIGCEGFVKASKVQGSSLLLSNADNFVAYSYENPQTANLLLLMFPQVATPVRTPAENDLQCVALRFSLHVQFQAFGKSKIVEIVLGQSPKQHLATHWV